MPPETATRNCATAVEMYYGLNSWRKNENIPADFALERKQKIDEIVIVTHIYVLNVYLSINARSIRSKFETLTKISLVLELLTLTWVNFWGIRFTVRMGGV